MKLKVLACGPAAVLLAASAALAGPVASYTGTLAATDDALGGRIEFTLASATTVTLQTFGFGGGVNGNGTAIAAGGFDPFLSLFSGSGDSASFIDGDSDIMSDYAAYIGCPPAGLVSIGGSPTCGDVRFSRSLAAGTYTVLLTAGAYVPLAAFGGGTLADGFADLTGGQFQTCIDATHCINTTGAWALDITLGDVVVNPPGLPEPATPLLAMLALLASRAGTTRRGHSHPDHPGGAR
ncbi:MAG: hypothetical protein GXC94_07560 [Comamonadaceae bacterium]|nr:hypothetical protein [Comamonadaceae bacterium]